MTTFVLAQTLVTLATVLITGAPLFADLNKTHATNPLWTPHARYHVVWQVLSYANFGILNIYLIWVEPNNGRLALSCIILFCIIVGFFCAAISIKRFGGKFYDTNGYLPFARPMILGRPVELDVNAVGFSAFTIVLIAAAVAIYHSA